MHDSHPVLAAEIGWKDGEEENNFKEARQTRREEWEAGKDERQAKRQQQIDEEENPFAGLR